MAVCAAISGTWKLKAGTSAAPEIPASIVPMPNTSTKTRPASIPETADAVRSMETARKLQPSQVR
jgi:hypothetical protein